MRHAEIAVTVDAAGAGTVDSTAVLVGRIVSVRMPNDGTALTGTGGTTDFTLTRLRDGGTILNAANQSAPWQFAPREQTFTTAAGSITYDGTVAVYDQVPVDDHVRLVVASGQPEKSGTVFLFYEDSA